MKKIIIAIFILLHNLSFSQISAGEAVGIAAGVAAITFIAVETSKKEVAKDISQFRSKEYIMNYIIGPTNGKTMLFETESLASDNSAGLISVAFNCTEVKKSGLLLAFFGDNINEHGVLSTAYGFRYIPLKEAQDLFDRINKEKEEHKKYLSGNNDVNNLYIEHKDLKFIIYNDGGEKVRVFWKGFQVVWEKTAYKRTEKRLDKWFE